MFLSLLAETGETRNEQHEVPIEKVIWLNRNNSKIKMKKGRTHTQLSTNQQDSLTQFTRLSQAYLTLGTQVHEIYFSFRTGEILIGWMGDRL